MCCMHHTITDTRKAICQDQDKQGHNQNEEVSISMKIGSIVHVRSNHLHEGRYGRYW